MKILKFIIWTIVVALLALGGAKLLGADFSGVELPKLPGTSDATSSGTSTPSTSSGTSTGTSEDVRKDLVTIDLTNSSSGTAVNPASLYQLFGNANILYPTDDHEVESPADFDKLFLDNGGLRFGSASARGWVNFFLEEAFDNVAISGYAYNKENPTNETWSCDTASLSIDFFADDGQTEINETVENFAFATNNGEYRAPESGTINLNSDIGPITAFTITGLEGRFTLITIELWND